jgi:hypothetical protein
LKLIWWLHLPITILPLILSPHGDSNLLRFTKEGLPSSLSLSKPFSTVSFPLPQWLTLGKKDLYKLLNMATILGYPNIIPKESHKWLPKFLGNNVIIADDHLYVVG